MYLPVIAISQISVLNGPESWKMSKNGSRYSVKSASSSKSLQIYTLLFLEGLVRTKTFFTLLRGVAYSVSKTELSSSSEVRKYDWRRWETNKQNHPKTL